MGWMYLAFAVTANICANISLKIAMTSRPVSVAEAIVSIPLWIGFTCCAVLLLCYLKALERLPVSICYSVVTVVAMMGIHIAAALYFNEPVSTAKIAGIALASLGIGVLVWSA